MSGCVCECVCEKEKKKGSCEAHASVIRYYNYGPSSRIRQKLQQQLGYQQAGPSLGGPCCFTCCLSLRPILFSFKKAFKKADFLFKLRKVINGPSVSRCLDFKHVKRWFTVVLKEVKQREMSPFVGSCLFMRGLFCMFFHCTRGELTWTDRLPPGSAYDDSTGALTRF